MELKEYISINQKYIYRQTDLYLLLQFYKKPKLERAELIARTKYPTETVQTCLARLHDVGILNRESAANGRYLYFPSDNALHFTEHQYNVINYMYNNHPLLMRPNSALLIFILLENKSFSIDELIQEGFKKSAVYNACLKLKEENIIEKSGGRYIFTSDFKNKVHAYSQMPVSKTVLELFKEDHQKLLKLVANSSGYTAALENLMLVYNLQEEQARELMSLRVCDLVGKPEDLATPES